MTVSTETVAAQLLQSSPAKNGGITITEAPRGGRARPELYSGLRSVPFHRYVIFYTVEGRDVRIERILHGARDIEQVFEQGDE